MIKFSTYCVLPTKMASMYVIWSPLNQMITIQVENSSETEIGL